MTSKLPFKITSYGLSDVGLVRANNEDVWSFLRNNHFFALADGMGGHNAGEIAAHEAVDFLCSSMKKFFISNEKKWTLSDLYSITKLSIQNANHWIYSLGQKKKAYQGMGTTLCVLLFHDNSLVYGHVGDSRIYRYREKKLHQLTTDHSLKNELISQGKFIETPNNLFPYKNVLTRALGTHEEVEAEINIASVKPNDLYLMCSDGLTDRVSDQEISLLIEKYKDPKALTTRLINAAKNKGGNDNITVVSIYIEQKPYLS